MHDRALDCDPRDQFYLLKEELGDTSRWNAGDSATYFAFFLHGWLARTGDAVHQQQSGAPAKTVMYQSAKDGRWYAAEPMDGVSAIKVNGKIYRPT